MFKLIRRRSLFNTNIEWLTHGMITLNALYNAINYPIENCNHSAQN